MFPFSQSVTPAVRSHLDVQSTFFNELSRSIASSFQSLCAANLQLSQSLFQENLNLGQRLLTTQDPQDVIGALSAGAHPAAGTLRAYQQHISRLAADTQVDLARVTEQHGGDSARSARSLADEVARAAAEQADRSRDAQEQALKNVRDPFQDSSDQGSKERSAAQGVPPARSAGAGGHPQSEAAADRASQQAGAPGNVTPPRQPQDQPAGQRGDGKPHK